MWSLSLVIPAYNEEAGIPQAVAEADAALQKLAQDYEIIVVDDGSPDATAERVETLTRRFPRLRLLRHKENQGYGASLRTGFEAARFDRVAFTDADCQFDLGDLQPLLTLTERAPIAVGRRVARQDAWRRRFYSRGYNLLVRGLLGTQVHDCDCALKVFRRDALKQLLPETNGFLVNAEMLTRARQRGMRIAEVGVRHRPRIHGTSKVSIADIPRTLMELIAFWWSTVLFPNAQRSTATEPRPKLGNAGIGLLLVAFVAFLLFFTRLNGPLLEPDEARYAEIPRQMLMAGNVVVPVLHGQPYYHKPPLLYWLVMVGYTAFGVHDWAARFVPCAAAFLAVIVAYLWGWRTVGVRAALFGSLMLCMSARFVYLGRMLTMDGLLALWVVAAWAAGHLAVYRRARFCEPRLNTVWWVLSAVACGLGALTKGPVALVLVAVPILAFQMLDQRTARPRLGGWMAYLLVVVAVAGPWFAAVGVRDASFFADFFWTHNIVRFTSPIDHQEPFWYFVPGLLLGMLPWTLLLPALAHRFSRRFGVSASRRPAGLGLFLLTSIWCLAFYSCAGCKRPGYILPVMPPLALALGFTLDAVLPRDLFARVGAISLGTQRRLAYRATSLVLAGATAVGVAAVVANLVTADVGLLLAGAGLTGLALQVRFGPLRSAGAGWGVCAGATLSALLIGVHQILPGYERKFSLREQVRPQRPLLETPGVSVVCYPKRWDSVSFYLGRDDVRVFRSEHRSELINELRRQPETVVFVKSDTPDTKPLKEFLEALPASLEFIPHSRHGIVTAGVVQRRAEAPAMLLAHR